MKDRKNTLWGDDRSQNTPRTERVSNVDMEKRKRKGLRGEKRGEGWESVDRGGEPAGNYILLNIWASHGSVGRNCLKPRGWDAELAKI